MKIELGSSIRHLLILGAGASVDYGLPTWNELVALIEEKINKSENEYLEHKEAILQWMSKVGEGKEYDTIDRCITKESRSKEYRSNGLTIENIIFSMMKEIFIEKYKEYEDGWIDKLNKKILDSKNLEHQVAFINYNYDNVLDENVLYSEYLTEKERKVDYRVRIFGLTGHSIPVYYPHGNFFSVEDLKNSRYSSRYLSTKKSDLGDVIDAVSCYESEEHILMKYGSLPTHLYILGLGGGLKVNLNNIDFNEPVSTIHITIRDESKKEEILNFLSEKFEISPSDINVYSSCEELVESCFN